MKVCRRVTSPVGPSVISHSYRPRSDARRSRSVSTAPFIDSVWLESSPITWPSLYHVTTPVSRCLGGEQSSWSCSPSATLWYDVVAGSSTTSTTLLPRLSRPPYKFIHYLLTYLLSPICYKTSQRSGGIRRDVDKSDQLEWWKRTGSIQQSILTWARKLTSLVYRIRPENENEKKTKWKCTVSEHRKSGSNRLSMETEVLIVQRCQRFVACSSFVEKYFRTSNQENNNTCNS